nr:transposase (putative), gypsy type [Tanacetum cinerariifolium]
MRGVNTCLDLRVCGFLFVEFPDWNATIKDTLAGKIGMYTCFIKFANYRVPLLKFLLYILEYYQIHLSQLSVIGAAKEISRDLLVFYGLSRSFIDTNVRPTLLHDNDEGTRIVATAHRPLFSLSDERCEHVSRSSRLWFPFRSGTSVVKDSILVDEAVDLPCVELLNENRTLIRKYPETFLCFVVLVVH